ncbi:MAG TPA: HAD family hydrolase [Candidatus Merdenecus merdavium]|nr:HAD family hydrolase [Candidatus Merdenecus merdavium]
MVTGIKFIVSDIDGTLLEEGKSSINPEMYDVIRKLKDQGVIFAAASGRQYQSIMSVFEPIKDDIIFIAENGSYVVCRGIDMLQVAMDPAIVRQMVTDLRRFEDCIITLSTKGAMYVDTTDKEFMDTVRNGYKADVRWIEDILQVNADVLKISIFRKDGVASYADEIIPKWKDRVHAAVSGHFWIDFMDSNADKGHAISSIQKILNISREETMAFGDNLNDLGMLRNAGYSYAVANAREEVKNVAKYIAERNVDDGVLKVMKTVLSDLQR